MKPCTVQDAGTIELYFYGELADDERLDVEAHLRHCLECAGVLGELKVIRAALAARTDVAAPRSGDWSAFMQRLDAAVGSHPRETSDQRSASRIPRSPSRIPHPASRIAHPASRIPHPASRERPFIGLIATAALLTIVAISVFFASQAGRRAVEIRDDAGPAQIGDIAAADAGPIRAGLASVGARHLERSKLVVLGLATKAPVAGEATDWAYERELATSLLNDTRLYRMAAEQRGLTSLAGVMRDLELVLLQTSMAQATDIAALPQIQRFIHKRGLVEKMDVVGTTGLLP